MYFMAFREPQKVPIDLDERLLWGLELAVLTLLTSADRSALKALTDQPEKIVETLIHELRFLALPASEVQWRAVEKQLRANEPDLIGVVTDLVHGGLDEERGALIARLLTPTRVPQFLVGEVREGEPLLPARR